jgi:hypothetical protein
MAILVERTKQAHNTLLVLFFFLRPLHQSLGNNLRGGLQLIYPPLTLRGELAGPRERRLENEDETVRDAWSRTREIFEGCSDVGASSRKRAEVVRKASAPDGVESGERS